MIGCCHPARMVATVHCYYRHYSKKGKIGKNTNLFVYNTLEAKLAEYSVGLFFVFVSHKRGFYFYSVNVKLFTFYKLREEITNDRNQ